MMINNSVIDINNYLLVKTYLALNKSGNSI